MDLASWYNQISVTETDMAKTAFCTPFGLWPGGCDLALYQSFVLSWALLATTNIL